jgi:hypothetical protein
VIHTTPDSPHETSTSHGGKVPIDILIPSLRAFYSEDVAELALWEEGYPEGDTTPTMVLEMERIYPLAKIARKALVEVFYEKGAWEEVLSSRENELVW